MKNLAMNKYVLEDETKPIFVREEPGSFIVKNWRDGEKKPFNRPIHIVIPFVNHLSSVEKEKVLEIIADVDSEYLSILTHENSNQKEFANSYSYVVENVQHILELPHDKNDKTGVFYKFLMLASLYEMKFLNRDNVNLCYASRDAFFEKHEHNLTKNKNSNGVLLHQFLLVRAANYSIEKIGNVRIPYARVSAAYSLSLSFYRWEHMPEKTLRQIVQEQIIFGHEVEFANKDFIKPAIGTRAYDCILELIDYLTNANDDLSNDERQKVDIWRLLSGGHSSTAQFANSFNIMDRTFEEFSTYYTFNMLAVRWDERTISPYTNSISLTDFYDRYPCAVKSSDDEGYQRAKKTVQSNPDVDLFVVFDRFDTIVRFLYALVNNEEKFIELMTEFSGMTDIRFLHTLRNNFTFLDFAKDFGEDEASIPLFLFLSLYGLDKNFKKIED